MNCTHVHGVHGREGQTHYEYTLYMYMVYTGGGTTTLAINCTHKHAIHPVYMYIHTVHTVHMYMVYTLYTLYMV